MILTVLSFSMPLGPICNTTHARYHSRRAGWYQRIWPATLASGGTYLVYVVAVGYMMALGAVASVLIALSVGVDVATIAMKGDMPVSKLVAVAIMVAGFYVAMLAVGPLIIAMPQRPSGAERRWPGSAFIPIWPCRTSCSTGSA